MTEIPSNPRVYSERQSRFRCGLHAINALLKYPAYTPASLDAIADDLRSYHGANTNHFRHPHRSMLGMGDYDINVLLVALQQHGMSARWFSQKQQIQSVINSPHLVGFLVNLRATSFLARAFSFLFEDSRHWVAIPRYYSNFFLVDSKRNQPWKFPSNPHLMNYFQQIMAHDAHVFIVEREQQADEQLHAT
ncbi:unnamed protein product [Agarophyton chilense]